MNTMYVRFWGTEGETRPVRPPLPLQDPLLAYAPFAYETREAALRDCASELASRWAEVAAGKRDSETAGLDHYVVECRIHPDGRIIGGTVAFEFPSWSCAGGQYHPHWDVDLSREEVDRLTQDVDPEGWTYQYEYGGPDLD